MVTRAITTEIETARGKQLTKRIVETLPKEDFERQAYLNCGRMSYVFLHSPPDHVGYMENETLRTTDGICKILGTGMSNQSTIGWEILRTEGTTTRQVWEKLGSSSTTRTRTSGIA